MTTEKFDLSKALKELEEINEWFQNSDIDLDEGLKKLKRGKELVLKCRQRIKSVENEFIDIKKELDKEPKDNDTNELEN